MVHWEEQIDFSHHSRPDLYAPNYTRNPNADRNSHPVVKPPADRVAQAPRNRVAGTSLSTIFCAPWGVLAWHVWFVVLYWYAFAISTCTRVESSDAESGFRSEYTRLRNIDPAGASALRCHFTNLLAATRSFRMYPVG